MSMLLKLVLLCTLVLCASASLTSQLVFHVKESTAMYQQVGLTLNAAVATVGWNMGSGSPLDGVGVYPLNSNGTQSAFIHDTGFQFWNLAANPPFSNFVAMNYNDTDATIDVYGIDINTKGQATTQWTNHADDTLVLLLGMSSVQINARGSNIGALYWTHFDPTTTWHHAAITWFDTISGKEYFTHNYANDTYSGLMQLSFDGNRVALTMTQAGVDGIIVLVLELGNGNSITTLLNTTVDFSSECFCFSQDGATLAYAFEDVYVWQETETDDGISFQLTNVYSMVLNGEEQLIAEQCDVQGNNLVVAAPNEYYLQENVYLFDTSSASSDPVWIYNGKNETSTHQDVPAQVAITADSRFAVVCTWGQAKPAVPTVYVFDLTADSTPAFMASTPGSMFSCALGYNEDGTQLYVLAGGKHVQANVFGDGGDLLLWSLTGF